MCGVLVCVRHVRLHAPQLCQVVLVDFFRQLAHTNQDVRSEDQVDRNEFGQSNEEGLAVWSGWPRCSSGKLGGDGRRRKGRTTRHSIIVIILLSG